MQSELFEIFRVELVRKKYSAWVGEDLLYAFDGGRAIFWNQFKRSREVNSNEIIL